MSIEKLDCRWTKNKGVLAIDCGCEPSYWYRNNQDKKGKINLDVTKRVSGNCKEDPLMINYGAKVRKFPPTSVGQTKLLLVLARPPFWTTTQTHAMVFEDLLSQIGGFCGLLIGASFISVFELMEFIFMTILAKVLGSNLMGKARVSIVSSET